MKRVVLYDCNDQGEFVIPITTNIAHIVSWRRDTSENLLVTLSNGESYWWIGDEYTLMSVVDS